MIFSKRNKNINPIYLNINNNVIEHVHQFNFLGLHLNSKLTWNTHIRVGVKYSTCTWYLYLSTYLSVLDVLEYLVYGNAKVLVLVLVLDQNVLGTYK